MNNFFCIELPPVSVLFLISNLGTRTSAVFLNEVFGRNVENHTLKQSLKHIFSY